MNKKDNMSVNTNPIEEDKGNFGWAVLGFFFPIIGLILFLCWMDNKKKSAKQAGIGALVGFLSKILFGILIFVLFSVLAFGAFRDGALNISCNSYGEGYSAIKENDTWYCVNDETKEKIKVLDINKNGINLNTSDIDLNGEDLDVNVGKDGIKVNDKDGNVNINVDKSGVNIDIKSKNEEELNIESNTNE